MDASKITAGSITADKIAIGAVTASRLYISPSTPQAGRIGDIWFDVHGKQYIHNGRSWGDGQDDHPTLPAVIVSAPAFLDALEPPTYRPDAAL